MRTSAVSASLTILADLPGGSLGGLQRDVAGEAFDDDDIDDALADLVAFDEAAIVDAAARPTP